MLGRVQPWLSRLALGWLFAFGGMSLSTALAQAELLIFGGQSNDVFLGCLTCNRFDRASVLNTNGPHGSRFATDSIWNRFGDYGGRFGTYSPCNRFGTNPPAVVDRQGNFYGYLTISRTYARRLTDRTVLEWLENQVCD